MSEKSVSDEIQGLFEEEIKKGKFTKADSKMSDEEIDDLLMD